MRISKLQEAIVEARRFLALAGPFYEVAVMHAAKCEADRKEYGAQHGVMTFKDKDPEVPSGKKAAAVKRASMDLTNALAAIRKSE